VEAVKRAEELKPDIILMDVGLPKLNGIEAARQISKTTPSSRILFLSAFDSHDVVEGALRTGASGYAVKLDAANELVGAVEAVLEGKQFISSRLKEPFHPRPRAHMFRTSTRAKGFSRRTRSCRKKRSSFAATRFCSTLMMGPSLRALLTLLALR